MSIIEDEQAAKIFLSTKLGVTDFSLLPVDLRDIVNSFKIKNKDEAKFLRVLSYLQARSQSGKSNFSALHDKIDKAIFDYCKANDPNFVAQPFDAQKALYNYRQQVTANISRLPAATMSYSPGGAPFKHRFKFWVGYRSASHKVLTRKGLQRFDKLVDRVYLGMLPNVNLGGKILCDFMKATSDPSAPYAVISTLQDYELFGDGAFQLGHANYFWHNQDVHHFQLPMLDNSIEITLKHTDVPHYSAADLAKILEVLEALHKLYQKNGSLYFHCKAGQGRSSFLAILFLCLFYKSWHATDEKDEYDIDATIENVHQKVCVARKQVDINNDYRRDGLRKIIKLYREQHPDLDYLSAPSSPRLPETQENSEQEDDPDIIVEAAPASLRR